MRRVNSGLGHAMNEIQMHLQKCIEPIDLNQLHNYAYTCYVLKRVHLNTKSAISKENNNTNDIRQ